jgi:hypothetical protein
MLEPEGRQLLLDALRPPAGYALDYALGTTYSLDLMSLLVAPLAFALFDREASDGRLVADPIALLEAVRRNADRMDIFCQAGQIAVPREHRAILNYLESSIHQAVPPNPSAIFHPKVWVIRYREIPDGQVTYRLLCLSRNLTFDRSWDTVLRLEGRTQPGGPADPRLASFVRSLPGLCPAAEVEASRAPAIQQLADELGSVVFEPPEGFDRIAFWPLGLESAVWPFVGRIDRLLVISPFVTAGCLARLTREGSRHILVSRPEALDLVGANAIQPFSETLILNPTAMAQEVTDPKAPANDGGSAVREAMAEQAGIELRGLHAKLYVADAPWRTRLWTGSANATDAAFGANVEFLVELEGPKGRIGIDAIVGERTDGVGIRKLLEPYRPSNEGPRALTPVEQLEQRLDELRRRLACLRFVASVAAAGDDTYKLDLRIESPGPTAEWWGDMLGAASFRCRPLSLGDAYLRPAVAGTDSVSIDFGSVSFIRLTSFFVIDLELKEGDARAAVSFVVDAELVGAPDDRRQRTLVALLENGRDVIRFLLLLLGEIGADDLVNAVDVLTGDNAPQSDRWVVTQWNALFEPMVRALAEEPSRLDEIARLMDELESTEAGRRLIPTDWHTVWTPIWRARDEVPTP